MYWKKMFANWAQIFLINFTFGLEGIRYHFDASKQMWKRALVWICWAHSLLIYCQNPLTSCCYGNYSLGHIANICTIQSCYFVHQLSPYLLISILFLNNPNCLLGDFTCSSEIIGAMIQTYHFTCKALFDFSNLFSRKPVIFIEEP